MKEETYTLKVSCKNCRTHSDIEVKMGTPVDEDTIGRIMIEHEGIKCPHCGCRELVKVW